MTSAGWTCLADELELDGVGLVIADAARSDELTGRCRDAGYTVVPLDTAGLEGLRPVQAEIAQALRLPAAAGRNLDAMADSLADLARYWPDATRIALVWRHPEDFIDADSDGWFRLVPVLAEATDRLWHGGDDPDDRLFETLVLVDGWAG